MLYRFDEGQGEWVKDHGAVAPPADLHIPHAVDPQWTPGQGLELHGVMPMIFTSGTEANPDPEKKLMNIAASNACTIELWISTATIYPPPFAQWSGSILDWEGQDNKRNFNLYQITDRCIFTTTNVDKPDATEALVVAGGMHDSLHHQVVTWDGKVTRYYLDGEKLAENAKLSWNTDTWDPKAALVLGEQFNGQRGYVGTYYLVAIHDRCLPDAEVLHNYQAGPSAR